MANVTSPGKLSLSSKLAERMRQARGEGSSPSSAKVPSQNAFCTTKEQISNNRLPALDTTDKSLRESIHVLEAIDQDCLVVCGTTCTGNDINLKKVGSNLDDMTNTVGKGMKRSHSGDLTDKKDDNGILFVTNTMGKKFRIELTEEVYI